MDIEERFWSKVEKTDGCWQWVGGLVSGNRYGCFYTKRTRTRAHRWSYERFVAPIPDGLEVDHLCRNTLCVRPDHLEAVTPAENKKRAMRGQPARGCAARHVGKTHCDNGHEFTEDNTYVRADGRGRECRACRAETQARYRERRAS